jgi:hypothetical protein
MCYVFLHDLDTSDFLLHIIVVLGYIVTFTKVLTIYLLFYYLPRYQVNFLSL